MTACPTLICAGLSSPSPAGPHAAARRTAVTRVPGAAAWLSLQRLPRTSGNNAADGFRFHAIRFTCVSLNGDASSGATNNDVPDKHHAASRPHCETDRGLGRTASGRCSARRLCAGVRGRVRRRGAGRISLRFHRTTEAAVCGALAILFIRYFARLVPARAAADRHGCSRPSWTPAKPDGFPNWALAIYALIGLALILVDHRARKNPTLTRRWRCSSGWAPAIIVLEVFLGARDGTPANAKAFDIIDELARRVARPASGGVARARHVLGFVLLFGGVALYAWQAGVTRVAGVACGPACAAFPGFETMIAAACGAAAVLFVILYTRLTLAAQRVFIDPLKFVRPGPQARKGAPSGRPCCTSSSGSSSCS